MSIDIVVARTFGGGFARTARSRSMRGAVTALALIFVAPLAGCGVNRALPPPVTPHDYRDRHPVVLAEAPFVMDIFPAVENGRLDDVNVGRLREFVARYRELGYGQITLLTPVGAPASRGSAALVRRALANARLRGHILVGTYPVTDPRLAAPIRLSFQSLKAKVSGRCGEWPSDLASGTSLEGWENQTYWNFGCATQATLSAQIADPRDLVEPRGETPSDIEMRLRGINRLRRGEDPTTLWRLKPTSISSVGGLQ